MEERYMFNEALLKRAESGDVEAALEVANCYYRGIDVEEDNDKAFAWFNRILEMDPQNATALTNMGSCYRGGFGVEQDHCKAVEYYERAVECNAKDALWYLAEYLYNGVGIEQNFTRAMELYVRAAELGDADAQVKLGNIYRDGEIVEVNHEEANKWFMLAMEQGNSDALYAMAEAYYNGFGVEKDVPKSTELWKKSAELGHWGAQGVQIDYNKAESYYRDVIDAGESDYYDNAVFGLALMYSTIVNDNYKAFPLWKLSAEHGNTTAKYNLGICYHNGWGTLKDDNQALYWWRQAGAEGDENANDNVRVLEQEMQNGNSHNNAEHHDTAQKKSIGCYVATAVYGSYDCPEVWTLRRFRDNILAETWYGRAFIKIYYAISPTIVKWFGHAKWFNHMWRGALDRMVDKLQSNGVESTPYEDENSKI